MRNVELDSGDITTDTKVGSTKSEWNDIGNQRNWWKYNEHICENCGEAFISRNINAKHCSRRCALKNRRCSSSTKAKLSKLATDQWTRDRNKLLTALDRRDLSNLSKRSRQLWKDPVFRQKIQVARKAVGYPDPNRPEQILKRKLRQMVKNSLHRTLKHLSLPKTDRTHKLMGYTNQELKEYLEKQFTGGMSWKNYGEWEIDHIRPIASFQIGTDVKIINALSNLRPLWKSENRKKWCYD